MTKREAVCQGIFSTDLVTPETTIFECYKKVLQNDADHEIHIKTLDRSGTSLADSVFSDLPCLLFGNKRVEKSNIQYFLKRCTTINDKFKREMDHESEHKIKRLELMCQTQLHLVTVSTQTCS